jgi:hypothetical protein
MHFCPPLYPIPVPLVIRGPTGAHVIALNRPFSFPTDATFPLPATWSCRRQEGLVALSPFCFLHVQLVCFMLVLVLVNIPRAWPHREADNYQALFSALTPSHVP